MMDRKCPLRTVLRLRSRNLKSLVCKKVFQELHTETIKSGNSQLCFQTNDFPHIKCRDFCPTPAPIAAVLSGATNIPNLKPFV